MAPLCAYVMALALLAIGAIALGTIAGSPRHETPSGMPGRGRSLRRAPSPSASSIFTKKQRLTNFPASRGRPQGPDPMERRRQETGRRARNLPPGGESESGRPGDRGNRRADGPERHARAGGRGVIDSKFGTVTLLRLIGGATRRTCLGFIKRIDTPNLRISGWSCQGDSENMPAQRATIACMLNRLTLLPPEMTRNWRNCSPAPNSGAATVTPRPYRPCRRTG